MFKRGLSLAIIMVMVSTLGFASFGDAIKKSVSDEEIRDGIKIESPSAKTVKSDKSDNLTISGTVTTPQGISVEMSLNRLDGKELIESAESLQSPSIPEYVSKADYGSEKEKNIVKKFESAYKERVNAGIAFEKARSAYEKAKKENKPAAKLNELKDDMDKASKVLSDARSEYSTASEAYSDMTTVYVFENEPVGKFAINKTLKAQPGYYNLIFRRTDNNRIVKVFEFEVISTDGFMNVIQAK